MNSGRRWSVILPGSRDERLSAFTTVGGEIVPTQYWACGGGLSLLRRALGRAEAITSWERVLVVVNDAERHYWEPELRDVPLRNLLVQPEDRGGAAALALALGEVLRRDPQAVVTVLPADHSVDSESGLVRALAAVTVLAAGGGRPIALVGVEPEDEDTEVGWVLPPSPGAAGGRSALVSTGHFAARGSVLAELLGRRVNGIGPLLADPRRDLRELYRLLPHQEIAAVLRAAPPESLAVVDAGDCGWNDLATPERVARCLVGLAGQPRWTPPNSLDLGNQMTAALHAVLAS